MNGNRKVAIIIPIFKSKLSKLEKISLVQALNFLNKFDIFYVCPKTLEYDYGYEKIKEIRFNDEHFQSVRKYSELMLQKEFYQAFSDYEYILIYQLDAFVFSDKLLDFCNLGYDYIGAPWIHGISFYKDAKHILHHVGNGGLSLRKVSSFITWLDKVDLVDYIETVNEDILISAFGEPYLNLPSIEVALKFSFDMDPRGCYERNNHQLPFGCHAWQKIDMEFWRPFIEQVGYDLGDIPNSTLFARYQWRYQVEEFQKKLLEKLSDELFIIPLIQNFTENGCSELYIWGTGVWGNYVGRIFKEFGIQVSGFINNKAIERKDFLEYPVVQGDVIFEESFRDKKILVAVQQSDEIEKQLNEAGYFYKKDYLLLKDLKNE